jgi:hypothetical protein
MRSEAGKQLMMNGNLKMSESDPSNISSNILSSSMAINVKLSITVWNYWLF